MSVDFNNSGAYFYDVGTDLDNLTELTVMAWVYAETLSGGNRDIVTHWDYSADKGWTFLYSNTGGKYLFEVAYDGGNNTDSVYAPDSDATGQWQHVLGRWKANERSCWLDGIEGTPDTTSRTSISDSSAELGISGQWNLGARLSGNYFDGRIALLKVAVEVGRLLVPQAQQLQTALWHS